MPAGYGKVAVLEELEQRLGVVADRVIYVGDGSSDVHVMLHVNNGDGFTIAVSENRQLARIARSTVLSDNAVQRAGAGARSGARDCANRQIRTLFESHGLMLHDWERDRTDRVKILAVPAPALRRRLERA